MTLQQLEYLVALDAHRRFSSAAEACFVTQPTLSAMLLKLEDELGVQLFDRRRQPVEPTAVGQAVIAQARRVLHEAGHLRELVRDRQEGLSGVLHVGIIPTLAPYLLPSFLPAFSEHCPGVELHVTERTTETIVQSLKNGRLDLGILATPLNDPALHEAPLFWEEFVVYAPHDPSLPAKHYLLPADIDPNRLILLEEGHCMRTQVVNLCALQRAQSTAGNLHYEAGSLETLRRLVETRSGITILPELALQDLDEDRLQYVRYFQPPAPVREISLVTHRSLARRRLVQALREEILEGLPTTLRTKPAPPTEAIAAP